jgi:hypothetical protein
MWTLPKGRKLVTVDETSRLASVRSRTAGHGSFLLFLLLMSALTFPRPTKGPNEPPFKDITVWEATTDLICANDRGDLDRSPIHFPKRFSKLPKGTQVVAVDAGGGMKRAILKLREHGNETVYIYVDEFKRHFMVAKTATK